MTNVVDNPELYARMAAPYETKEAALEAAAAFLKDLEALREKHRIPEVVVACAAYGPGGREDVPVQVASLGNSDVGAFMAAVVFGQVSGPLLARARLIEKLARGEAAAAAVTP